MEGLHPTNRIREGSVAEISFELCFESWIFSKDNSGEICR